MRKCVAGNLATGDNGSSPSGPAPLSLPHPPHPGPFDFTQDELRVGSALASESTSAPTLTNRPKPWPASRPTLAFVRSYDWGVEAQSLPPEQSLRFSKKQGKDTPFPVCLPCASRPPQRSPRWSVSHWSSKRPRMAARISSGLVSSDGCRLSCEPTCL